MNALYWLRGILFGAGGSLEELGVIEIREVGQLQDVLKRSTEVPVFLFKHSTTCPISSTAHKRVAEYLAKAGAEAPPVYLVKVIESRPLSDEITYQLGVKHESPQLILVHDAKPVWSASHGSIDVPAIERAIDVIDG